MNVESRVESPQKSGSTGGWNRGRSQGGIVRYKDGLDTSVIGHHVVEEFPTANVPADYIFFVGGKNQGSSRS